MTPDELRAESRMEQAEHGGELTTRAALLSGAADEIDRSRETPVRGKPWPRRAQMALWTPAERAIWDAAQLVEAAGCHPALTDAVNLLQAARAKVADFVDSLAAGKCPTADKTIGEALTRQAREAAEPDCRECGGSGLVGWGLTVESKAAAVVPCIRCRRPEYVAAAEGLVNRQKACPRLARTPGRAS